MYLVYLIWCQCCAIPIGCRNLGSRSVERQGRQSNGQASKHVSNHVIIFHVNIRSFFIISFNKFRIWVCRRCSLARPWSSQWCPSPAESTWCPAVSLETWWTTLTGRKRICGNDDWICDMYIHDSYYLYLSVGKKHPFNHSKHGWWQTETWLKLFLLVKGFEAQIGRWPRALFWASWGGATCQRRPHWKNMIVMKTVLSAYRRNQALQSACFLALFIESDWYLSHIWWCVLIPDAGFNLIYLIPFYPSITARKNWGF